MKDIYLSEKKDLFAHFPTCKFVGKNLIMKEAKLENCKIQDCQIFAPLQLENINLQNAIIKPRNTKHEKQNIFLSEKYFNFLLNFDKNLFDGIKIGIVCINAHICNFAKKLFETMHAEVETCQTSFDGFTDGKPTQLPRGRTDIWFLLDENAKRLWAVHAGQTLNGDEILYLLAWWLNGQNKLGNTVVGTKFTNLGIENKLRGLGIGLRRTENLENEKDIVLAAAQNGQIQINWENKQHGALLAMRALASIYLENKNIWQRVKENKYVQVFKTIHLPHTNNLDDVIQTFVKFYTLKLKNQGRVEIWIKDETLNIMVESIEKTTALVLAMDIKKKILKYIKN
ncbi:MAG: hypothetical protein IKB21_04120 [Clostridia bacterium]|nr:hypothetical protein [Clostridia bacterium]